jgi:hypothetical protein
VAKELSGEHGVRAEVLTCDLADADARAALPGRVAELGLRVDVLVNNAGFGTSGPFHEADLEREVQQVRVLVEAVVDLTGRVVPAMVERKSGAVLNVASTAGFQPLPRMAGYGAAKAWVRSFTSSLHEELRHHGIAVTALSPGPVETEFFEQQGLTPVEALFPKAVWVQPDEAARVGVEGLERNRPEVIPGLPMRVMIASSAIVPRNVSVPLFGRAAKARGA